jgi:hypothetical protein
MGGSSEVLNPGYYDSQADQNVIVFIDICNSAVFTVDGQPFKLPAVLSGK